MVAQWPNGHGKPQTIRSAIMSSIAHVGQTSRLGTVGLDTATGVRCNAYDIGMQYALRRS